MVTEDLTCLPADARTELTRLRAELALCREISDRVHALEHDVAVLRAERDLLRAELTGSREDRDRLRLRLADAELALSSLPGGAAGVLEPLSVRLVASAAGAAGVALTALDEWERRALDAEQRADELARELTATRLTVSWRVTAPLRALRRKTSRS